MQYVVGPYASEGEKSEELLTKLQSKKNNVEQVLRLIKF